VALAPDGAGFVRSNVGPAELGTWPSLLAEIADGAAFQRADSAPPN